MECKAINCSKERNSYYYNDYCSYHRECLDKLFSKNSSIKYVDIRELETFETWFNKNCGYVINYDYSSSAPYYTNPYYIWIVVYEPAVRSMGEHLATVLYVSCYNCLSSASYEAQELKNKLQKIDFSVTPILDIHSKTNSYEHFSSLITSPYVEQTTLPYEPKWREYNDDSLFYEPSWEIIPAKYPDNPSEYLKPLDIVKIEKEPSIKIPFIVWNDEFYHFGIYLGNNKICHVTDPYSGNKDTRDTNRVVVTDWDEFIKGGVGKLVRIHPVIPFKHYQKIAKNIAWDENNRHIEGRYCVANNNCEHYTNHRIFGLNWSEQVAEKPRKASEYARYSGVNNRKRDFRLRDELEKSFSELDNWRSREIVGKCEIEVPPKKDCRIM